MPKTLTARFVESVKPPKQGRAEYPDAALPGFRLRVTSSGIKSFSLRYRSPVNRKHRRLTWAYPGYSLADARDAAQDAVRAVQRGDDPAPEKQPPGAPLALPGTVSDLCDKYVDNYLKKNVRRWQQARGELDNHIKPRIGALGIDDVTRAHVRAMLAEIEPAHPVAANRALQRLRALYNWAMGQDLAAANPTSGVKKPTREQPASRVLNDAELVAVWNAADALNYPAREYTHFLMTTGQRRDDVRLMHWSEIDLEMGNWTIPASRYKSRRPHLVPLTDGMMAMLKVMPFRDASAFVFSATGGKAPYANLMRPKRTLDKVSGVIGWTWHDVRRTLRTGLSRLGIRPDVAERVIGHSVGGRLGEVYDLYDYREEKLRALDAWATHIDAALTGRVAENVVALRGRDG